ncbi:hypothetical protein T492DRAFT_1152475 [Pavlovales sp. CCMP2436]|nr:hypothetical protein T492DRAFT_1152475 [Pavlovales sp. CCMP2436]
MAFLLLLLVAASAPRSQELQLLPFRFESPTTGRTLSMCICAKCGSTSVYAALFAAIAGHPFERWVAGRPIVHEFWKWGLPGLLELAYGASRTDLDVHCMYLDDFALALRAVHNNGEMARLDPHYLPQHLQLCPPVLRKKGLLIGNVSELTPSLARLGGFNFVGGHVQVGSAKLRAVLSAR